MTADIMFLLVVGGEMDRCHVSGGRGASCCGRGRRKAPVPPLPLRRSSSSRDALFPSTRAARGGPEERVRHGDLVPPVRPDDGDPPPPHAPRGRRRGQGLGCGGRRLGRCLRRRRREQRRRQQFSPIATAALAEAAATTPGAPTATSTATTVTFAATPAGPRSAAAPSPSARGTKTQRLRRGGVWRVGGRRHDAAERPPWRSLAARGLARWGRHRHGLGARCH